jgi:hypothetical protein
MFIAVKNYVRRYSALVIVAHILFAVAAPLLHAHSATPLSTSHPEQIHIHLLTAAPEIGVCALTGNQRHIFTSEAVESRQSDKTVDDVSDLKVVSAYPILARIDQHLSISAPTQRPRDLIEIDHFYRAAELSPPNPQAP